MNALRLLAAVLALSLTACAPATLQELRKEHAGSRSFEADQNYQAVYRAVLDRARTCFQTGMITAAMVVQGDLYTDIRSGSVTVALHGGFGVDTHLGIDIAALSEARTKVQVYNALGAWDSAARAVEGWVTKSSTDCRA